MEHDACGIGFLCNIDGRQSHDIVVNGFKILYNLTHRGACGCDPDTGDGCGMLLQLPHLFFQKESEKLGFDLPEKGRYGVGMLFMPQNAETRAAAEAIINTTIEHEGQTLLGWRDVPRDSDTIGWLARRNEPVVRQVFIKASDKLDDDSFERKLFVIRKSSSIAIRSLNMPGAGNLLCGQHVGPYDRVQGVDVAGSGGSVLPGHTGSRFSVRPGAYPPTVQHEYAAVVALAQPFRFLAHNGEINTLRGNINMFRSREGVSRAGFSGTIFIRSNRC